MYTPVAVKRPRLPSMLTVCQPMEQFRDFLRKAAPGPRVARSTFEALDAYLTHLLLSMYQGELLLIDLAAESTAGMSSLIGLLHPHVHRVLSHTGPAPEDRPAYPAILKDFLHTHYPTSPSLERFGGADTVPDLGDRSDAVILLDAGTASPAVLGEQAEHWLNKLPDAIVLVFGLGAVGDCVAVEALLRRFSSASPHRFRLIRDCGESLGASRLGMVTTKGHPQADVLLARLKDLFTSNYSFLSLLRSTTERAIQSTSSERDVLNTHSLFCEWNEEINRLKDAARQARREAHQAEQQLLAFQRTLAYRMAVRVHRWRSKLAPDQSWRHRTYHRARRAAQIWRRFGSWGLVRRIIHRCLRPGA